MRSEVASVLQAIGPDDHVAGRLGGAIDRHRQERRLLRHRIARRNTIGALRGAVDESRHLVDTGGLQEMHCSEHIDLAVLVGIFSGDHLAGNAAAMDDGIEAMMHEQPVQELRIGDVAGHRGEVDRAVGARDI